MSDGNGNRFFALRHGQSVANVKKLVVGDPQVGCQDYGLSGQGAAELRTRVATFAETVGDNCQVVSSDFLRTRQTAEIFAGVVGVDVKLSIRLRERFFGAFEGTSNTNYQRVWDEDRANPEHTRWSVESVSSVAERMLAEVQALNESAANTAFVLVSHGDPLQILETALSNLPLTTHRDRVPLQPGELRELST